MTEVRIDPAGFRLQSPAGLSFEINANGSLRRIDCDGISLLLFPGNEMEGGVANLYLRQLTDRTRVEHIPLLGPRSPTRFVSRDGTLVGHGAWSGIEYSVALVLAQTTRAWFWHVRLHNASSTPQQVDLTYAQDLALASYGAVRLNEFYVSQYIDHTPLPHAERGVMIASRQNQAAGGRYPWSLIGSLRKGVSFATDAKQFHGLATRKGDAPPGLLEDLPGRRLQHEHSLAVIRDAAIQIAPGTTTAAGFFGLYLADHPDATSSADLERLPALLGLPEARAASLAADTKAKSAAPSSAVAGARTSATTDSVATGSATLFSSAPLLAARELNEGELRALFNGPWRHEERDEHGRLLSFFHGDSHVVLREKELRVQRPHGHLLRGGRHLSPDESAATSTVWMNGVFHSMLTQGHVSINRYLSTVHTYLGLFRSHGLRVFAEIRSQWQLLDVPSVFEMQPQGCAWVYRHEDGDIRVASSPAHDPAAMLLSLQVASGGPTRFLISQHIALNGDDGSVPGAARWRRDGDTVIVTAAPGGDVAYRFPNGRFVIEPIEDTRIEQVAGDELLFADGQSREQPFLCMVTARGTDASFSIRGELISGTQAPAPVVLPSELNLIPKLSVAAPESSPLANAARQLADIAPWFTHNALVHYLSPRGLEQYSGGGWGTRDVCQGPVELLLALGRIEPIRDLLLRVLGTQNPDGDWPQWFMFFERERNIRPGDSHGDIVFWPLLVLAQYLVASADAAVLDERVPFFDSRGAEAAERATVWQHIERALTVISKRVIPGTALAAYGHGDWNDSLQPADPALRDHLCSAWTVTLHFQVLTELAAALRSLSRATEAARLETWAESIRRDFQRILMKDGVLTGYAHFEDNGSVRYLLHPSDDQTGVRYSSLAMIHAILEDLLTPEQARAHLRLIDEHLSAADGVRLFDRPMSYHGGLQRLFQRAESATYFGREIGLMYMHAHLRFAQALAHMGEADRFFHALCQANPIGIRSIVPAAGLRQANCYYSSSDAAFEDRYQASAEYERVPKGTIALDGGWRVYSSGAGIALGLIFRRFLGLGVEASALVLDPVIPSALNGLRVQTALLERPIEVQYQIGKAGCGVEAATLNGKMLTLAHASNPHRRGAARAVLKEVREGLAPARNVLQIRMG